MLDDDLLARVPELRTAGAIPEGDRQGAGRAAGHGHVAGGHRPAAQRPYRSLRCRLLGELRLEHGPHHRRARSAVGHHCDGPGWWGGLQLTPSRGATARSKCRSAATRSVILPRGEERPGAEVLNDRDLATFLHKFLGMFEDVGAPVVDLRRGVDCSVSHAHPPRPVQP